MKSFLTPILSLTLLCSTGSAAASAYTSTRPLPEQRLFTSLLIEDEITRVANRLTNPKLRWMFQNCFPNTLDTTVYFSEDSDGTPDTFVITGDIDAMWLRDSSAQVWPYLQFVTKDEHLRKMIEGLIRRQTQCLIIDPYANAFNREATGGQWQSDQTEMDPRVHERKWELDSPCYAIRLAYEYWKLTGDTSIFDDDWLQSMKRVLQTFRTQQRKNGDNGDYRFLRVTDRAYDTLPCNGWGTPVSGCGLIASSFRPSDDATTMQYLIPSNFFAVTSMHKVAEVLRTVLHDDSLASEFETLASEVSKAIRQYAIYHHPTYGDVYAYEVDGFGNRLLMDDANVPSLLALPYMGDISIDDPIYQNTRRMVWSTDNPYFFSGTKGEGIGGPHVGYDMAWPMSIMMRAFTSTDDREIAQCLRLLMNTDAGTGMMHESFDVNNPDNFTRSWFAWQNTLFGELILHLIATDRLSLLNSL